MARKKLFTESRKNGINFVFSTFSGCVCIGVGNTRKEALEMAFDDTVNRIHDLTTLKDQLVVAHNYGKKRVAKKKVQNE